MKKCAEEIVKKPTARPPCTKVCQPAYPGWEGIAGNVLFQPEGYITVATFAAKGEFLFTLAPDSLMEECSGVQKILYALESAFGLRYFEVNFDLIADDQLQKAFSQLQSATYA
ncbi:MAG: hypothetical protein Q8L09_05105 [Candidatus Moranbacteria bacterium]|nr:hypothetical protein [Candidatus Moranbacteria bacterium]